MLGGHLSSPWRGPSGEELRPPANDQHHLSKASQQPIHNPSETVIFF